VFEYAELYMQVPFEEVPSLVAERRVLLRHGFAYATGYLLY